MDWLSFNTQGETDRQTGRQAGRQAGRQEESKTDRETLRKWEKEREKERGSVCLSFSVTFSKFLCTDRHADIQVYLYKDRHYRERHKSQSTAINKKETEKCWTAGISLFHLYSLFVCWVYITQSIIFECIDYRMIIICIWAITRLQYQRKLSFPTT